jgi:hypothetical protein
MDQTERFLTLLWAVAGCRCEHWARTDGTVDSLRLYQGDLLLSQKRFTTARAVWKCAEDWRELVVPSVIH